MPRPLLSEALRGHGALLRDARGERFVDELAPRDVVSRAMAERMREQGGDHLWLDATGLDAFGSRFPTITASLAAIGLDPSRDWLPIAPAAHYLSGGVVTDLSGATALPGLWAAGEVACTGVHGANRLASNSLLEGMVFGARLAESILGGGDGPDAHRGDARPSWPTRPGRPTRPTRRRWRRRRMRPRSDATTGQRIDVHKERDRLQRAMIEGAGVVRSAGSLAGAAVVVAEVGAALGPAGPPRRADGELANWWPPPGALLAAAACGPRRAGRTPGATSPPRTRRGAAGMVHSGDRVAVLTGSAVAGPGAS